MIIDSHCHIDFSDFDNDRAHVLQRAKKVGIEKIIIPGVMHRTWHKIRSCCETHSILYPSYGLHPYFIEQHQTKDLNDLKNWIDSNKAIAVGECGLDFFLKNLDVETQIFYFEAQLDIALESNLPVIIHARKSTEAVIKAIKKRPDLRGMIHSYSGSYEQAMQLIGLGFYLSFGGSVTYEKSTRLRNVVKKLPLDFLLVETDAPDQPVASAKNRRNEPSCIIDVINHIADLHQTRSENIATITANNALELFNVGVNKFAPTY